MPLAVHRAAILPYNPQKFVFESRKQKKSNLLKQLVFQNVLQNYETRNIMAIYSYFVILCGVPEPLPLPDCRRFIMIFLGDYFALGLVIILCVFFFDSKISIRHMPKTSKLFICCLVTTALTAVTDLITGQLQTLSYVPLWQNILWNSLYFVVNIITTTSIALYLFTRILEHTHEQHCMKKACIGLTVLFAIYMCFVIANIWNGLLFYFDEKGAYCRGPLNALGYIVTLAQLVLVSICYVRNRKNASHSLQRVWYCSHDSQPLDQTIFHR